MVRSLLPKIRPSQQKCKPTPSPLPPPNLPNPKNPEHNLHLPHLRNPLAPLLRKPLPSLPHGRHPNSLRQRTRRRRLHPPLPTPHNNPPPLHPIPPPHHQIRKLQIPKIQPRRRMAPLPPPHHRLRLLPRLPPPSRNLHRRLPPPNQLPLRNPPRPLPLLLRRLHLRHFLPRWEIHPHRRPRRPRLHLVARRTPHRSSLPGPQELGKSRRIRPLALRWAKLPFRQRRRRLSSLIMGF